jgi:protein-disulfide isomerase
VSRRLTRRAALAVMAGAMFDAPCGWAESALAFPLETPDGATIRNFAISPALAPADLPGVIVAGAAEGAPVLYEFFDYSCPYCRLAAQELDLLLGPESGMRLGLLHHPVLGPRSAEAALFVLAAQKLYGDEAALRLHVRLFEAPGRMGADKARAVAESLSLDPARLTAEAGRGETQAVLDAHANRALALGLRQTPAFVLGNYAFIGWPGSAVVQEFVQALKRCGGLACPGTAQ